MSNKISDKNVANIEEDVKILEEFAEICKAGLACYDQTREGEALERILAEREQKDKRIQELEEENLIQRKQIMNIFDNDYIPKQVVIDLIANETIDISGFECIAVEDLEKIIGG